MDITQRMIFHLNGKAFHFRIVHGFLGDGPAGQNISDLQAEIIMFSPGMMPLDDEPVQLFRFWMYFPGSGVFSKSLFSQYFSSRIHIIRLVFRPSFRHRLNRHPAISRLFFSCSIRSSTAASFSGRSSGSGTFYPYFWLQWSF
jgi:hypothetical protein